MKPRDKTILHVADTETIWYQAGLIFRKDPKRKDYAIIKWNGEIIYVTSSELEENPELLQFIRVKLPLGEVEDSQALVFSKIMARLLWEIHGYSSEDWNELEAITK